MDMKTLYAVCDRISDELDETNERLKKIPKLSTGDIEYIRGLTSILKSIKTIITMEEADGYSNNYPYYDGNSYARRGNIRRDTMGGYSRAQRRDSMGRYSRAEDDFKMELQELINEAPNDQVRQKMQDILYGM